MKYLVLLICYIFINSGYSQTSYLSYPKQLCQDDLFKPISICLNEKLQSCPFNCPSGSNGGGYWIDQYFEFYLTSSSSNPFPVSQISSSSNVNISNWCTEITFGATGIYTFNLFLKRSGSRPFSNCLINNGAQIPQTYEDTLMIGSITINISPNNLCNNYSDTVCNLLKNGGFEEYITCPSYINYGSLNNLVNYWIEPYSTSKSIFLNQDCSNIQISRNTNISIGTTKFPSLPDQPFPSGRGAIACGYDNYYKPLSHAQYINLCDNQKYRFSFHSMRGKASGQVIASNSVYSDLGIYTGAGITFPLPGSYTNTPASFNQILNIPINDFTNYFDWHKFSYQFTNIGNTNSFIFQNSQSGTSADLFFDNLSITPIDTVIFNTQLIANRCDSAEMILNIPGCYGPYNLDIVVNTDTLQFSQIQDGHTIKIPLAKNNIVKVLSITNSLGCATVLNTSDTLIVNNSGDASFTSSDFCEGQTNTITFLADTGTFALVNNTTSATIDVNTGIISGANGNQIFIISHAVCLDTVHDTIQVFSNSAGFTSSDICVGGINTININGTTGGTFSLSPSANGATINPTTGIITGGTSGNSYTIKYKVGNPCPDSSTQTIQVVTIEDPSFTTSDFCLNSANQITINGTLNGSFSFSPTPSDSATINQTTGIISNPTAGSIYSIKYITPGACKDSSVQNSTAFTLPTSSIFGNGGDLCSNDSIPITVNLTGTPPWSITYTDGTISQTIANITSSPYTLQAKTKGTYSITSITDSVCSHTGDTTFALVKGDSIMFWADITDGCAPQQVKFWSNTTGINGDCIWVFGDGTDSVNNCDTVYHTYDISGNHAVKLSVSSPKCSGDTTLSNLIKINSNPEAIFYFTPQNPSVLNNTVSFTNNSKGNISDEWYLNNSFVNNIPEPDITFPPTIGNHEICLIVENTFGCFDTTCSDIYVLDESLIYIPNAFIPNNDGLNDIFKPAISNTSKYNLKIFNRWGKMIFETNDSNEGWNGKQKGIMSKEGVYLYRITYRFQGNFDDQFLQGHFLLLK